MYKERKILAMKPPTKTKTVYKRVYREACSRQLAYLRINGIPQTMGLL
jgi:hypothetical protein